MTLTIILTLIVEIPILVLFGFRKKDILTIGILINIVTNAAANVLMYRVRTVIDPSGYRAWLLPVEAICVLVEFLAMSYFSDKKAKLILIVMLANALSYAAGVIAFGR